MSESLIKGTPSALGISLCVHGKLCDRSVGVTAGQADGIQSRTTEVFKVRHELDEDDARFNFSLTRVMALGKGF